MWKRIELHNHSNESDGSMTAPELVSFFADRDINAFSLTDHNTLSGCGKLAAACRKQNAAAECISGCELTTYYGHLLCQNLSSPIRWEDLDKSCADFLFERVHEAGGLAGPAHPFSIPSPFSNGMRWTMKIRNLHLIDFVEIINNSHPMLPDNKEAILWWEELILSGIPAAAVSGLDLHAPMSLSELYKTYIFVSEEDQQRPLSVQLDRAIRSCLTCVTKTDVLSRRRTEEGIHIFFERNEKNQPVKSDSPGTRPRPILCQIRTRENVLERPMTDGACFVRFSELPAHTDAVICSAFDEIADLTRLLAIAPPLLMNRLNRCDLSSAY